MPLARLGTQRALARARKRPPPSGRETELQTTDPPVTELQMGAPSAKEPLRKPLLQRAAARLVEPWLVEQEQAEFRNSPPASNRVLAPRQ
jgi:hypothetical protein